MFNYDFDFSELSLIAQSLLARMDFISDSMKSFSPDSDIYAIYEKDLASVRALYDKLVLKP